METTAIQQYVARLDRDSPPEAVWEAWNLAKRLRELAREVGAQADAAILAWFDATGTRQLIEGSTRLYVGTVKRQKVRSHEATLEALLDATAGDVTAIAAVLASDAWKFGELRRVVGTERFEQLVETIVALKPESTERKRELRAVDTRFAGGSTPYPQRGAA